MRSRSALAGVVQCLCLLGKAAVLQGFLPAPSVGPARSAAVLRHASSLARASEHASSRSGSRRRRIGATLSRRAPPALSMSSSSSPGGGGSSGVGAAIAKSWVALLLCVASVFGPDVLMQQGIPISPRPPQASALSEEQVSPTSAGCHGRSLRGLAAWGMSFVSRVLSYRNAGCAHAYLRRFDAFYAPGPQRLSVISTAVYTPPPLQTLLRPVDAGGNMYSTCHLGGHRCVCK